MANFRGFVDRIYKAEIVRVFSLTSVSTLVRMLTGFISIKVVSSIVGPAGIALLGQLNNFIQIISACAQGGINNGVTKYVAEYKHDEYTFRKFLATAFRFTFYCSLVTGGLCLIFSRIFAQYIMLNPDYYYLFIILGCFLIFFSFNNLILSVINGLEEYKRFVLINIWNSAAGVMYSVILVLLWGLTGALIGVVTFQSFMFVITISMVRKLGWFQNRYWQGKIDVITLKKYFHYSVMTFVTISIIPVTQLILRSYVIIQISEIEAGWWEAMNRLSNMYLMVITSSFSVYYLPKLSAASDNNQLRHEIIKAAKFILPLLLCGLGLIYLLRYLIIKVLFAPDFLPMENLFIWQLIGDFFKIGSWLIAFVMVAKSYTKRFITLEIVFGLSYLGLAFLFIQITGNVTGFVQAYFINYLLYAITMFFLYRKLLLGYN